MLRVWCIDIENGICSFVNSADQDKKSACWVCSKVLEMEVHRVPYCYEHTSFLGGVRGSEDVREVAVRALWGILDLKMGFLHT